MRIATVVLVILLVLFFVLPVLSEYASVPSGVAPQDIGEFLGGVLRYWYIVLSRVFHSIFAPAPTPATG